LAYHHAAIHATCKPTITPATKPQDFLFMMLEEYKPGDEVPEVELDIRIKSLPTSIGLCSGTCLHAVCIFTIEHGNVV
jgi:hypothetical protein